MGLTPLEPEVVEKLAPADRRFWDAAVKIRESKTARDAACRKGQLWWFCYPLQFRRYQRYYASDGTHVWNCARRDGKSTLQVLLHLETGLRKPRARTAFAASNASDVAEVVEPILEDIIQYIPPDIRPVLKLRDHKIVYPSTKAVTKVAGADHGKHRHLRGRGLDLWSLDEAGFVPAKDCHKVVNDVFSPQTWTTGGKGIIASTPPDVPGHPFQNYYLAAKKTGLAAHFTFWDNPMFTDARRQQILQESADKVRMTVEDFIKTTVYQREFLAEFVMEQGRAVMPYFTEKIADECLILEDAVPLFADYYVIVDLGGSRDPSAFLACRYEAARRRLTALACRVIHRPTESVIRNTIWDLVEGHVPPASVLRGNLQVVMDDDSGIVANTLANPSHVGDRPIITVRPYKEDSQGAWSDTQEWILEGRVKFLPEAREAMVQCQAAVWNPRHSDLDRIEGYGHFDAATCVKYAVRNIIRTRQQVPDGYGQNDPDVLYPIRQQHNTNERALMKALWN